METDNTVLNELIDALFAANTALAECQRQCWVGARHRDKDPVLTQVKEAREKIRAALKKVRA